MSKLLLCLHVLAALLAIGPVAVAASMFPKALRRAHSDPGDREGLATLRVLHRICRVYAAIGIAVPVFGFATAGSLGVLGSAWLITSIALTAAAAAILVLLILPAQDGALALAQAPDPGPVAPSNYVTFRLFIQCIMIEMIRRSGVALSCDRPRTSSE